MKNTSMILIVAAILVLATDQAAAERMFNVNKVFSGSGSPIAMDINEDGIPAVQAIGGGPASNFSEGRPFTGDNVSEAVPVEQPTGQCAVDEIEFAVFHYSSVHRYSNGDLLISRLKEGFTCYNPATYLGHGVLRLEYIGGTGRYEGARGETVREFNAWAVEPTGVRTALTGKETGTLILP